MHHFSPLRYPGGKSRLLPLAKAILDHNDLTKGIYAEPFAGGAGLALGLLYSGYVSEIMINDVDAGIFGFWHSTINETEEFIEKLMETPINIAEWELQKETLSDPNSSGFQMGFAAFFLNRTNRSGVIKGGGVLGGRDQKGNYPIDCRFNKDELCKRIRRLGRYRSQIHVSNLDASKFIIASSDILGKRSFIYADPPYVNQGSSLYTNFYELDDHKKLSLVMRSIDKPWMVTYDDCDQIGELYGWANPMNLSIDYSLNRKRKARELIMLKPGLSFPKSDRVVPIAA